MMSESASEAPESSIDEGDMAQFKEDVKRFLLLPEQIAAAKEPIKEMTKEYKELEASITAFMTNANIPECNISKELGGGKLKLVTQKKTPAPKKDNYKSGIEAFLKKRAIDATFEEIEEEINKTREQVETTTLKRHKK